jgi:hypothetical protein
MMHKPNYHMPSHFLNTFSPVCAPKGHLSLAGTLPCLSITREPNHVFVAIIVQDSQIAEFWLHETHSIPSGPSSFAMPCGLVG